MARSEAPIKTGLTFEDYVTFEQASSVKHEFVDGQLFMMFLCASFRCRKWNMSNLFCRYES
jgi:hypothetical protein